MNKMKQGFTLIELMIVVAVIGVLAAIAIPQYQNYVAKAELAAAYSTVSALKVNYEDYVANNASEPTNDVVGAPKLDEDVGEITVDASGIKYDFGTKVSAKIGEDAALMIEKSDSGWACKVSGLATSATLPKGCK
ncbi:MAG: pilin [Plesiomonas sp.]|uniref:pilin n=1 Tax=Plesiomonas sp. TaxID=2486279 RepID=UPI003F366D56